MVMQSCTTVARVAHVSVGSTGHPGATPNPGSPWKARRPMPSPMSSSSSGPVRASVAAPPGLAAERFLSGLGTGEERLPSECNRLAHAMRRPSTRLTCAASASTSADRGPTQSGSDVQWSVCGKRHVPCLHHWPVGSSPRCRLVSFSARLTAAASAVLAASCAVRLAAAATSAADGTIAPPPPPPGGRPAGGGGPPPGTIDAAAAMAATRAAPAGMIAADLRASSTCASASPDMMATHSRRTASQSSHVFAFVISRCSVRPSLALQRGMNFTMTSESIAPLRVIVRKFGMSSSRRCTTLSENSCTVQWSFSTCAFTRANSASYHSPSRCAVGPSLTFPRSKSASAIRYPSY